MKNFILLLLVTISFTSCTTDYLTPQEEYAANYQAYKDKDKQVTIHLQFDTTYQDYTISVFDVDNNKYIYQGDTNTDTTFVAKYKSRYIFQFTPNNKVSEPYVFIHLKNITDNKIIDEYEYEGCILGYTNSFLAL